MGKPLKHQGTPNKAAANQNKAAILICLTNCHHVLKYYDKFVPIPKTKEDNKAFHHEIQLCTLYPAQENKGCCYNNGSQCRQVNVLGRNANNHIFAKDGAEEFKVVCAHWDPPKIMEDAGNLKIRRALSNVSVTTPLCFFAHVVKAAAFPAKSKSPIWPSQSAFTRFQQRNASGECCNISRHHWNALNF